MLVTFGGEVKYLCLAIRAHLTNEGCFPEKIQRAWVWQRAWEKPVLP
jgi:hypothetical protein